MRAALGLRSVLQTGGFSFHRQMGTRVNVGFLGQSCAISALSAVAVFSAALYDGTLFLPGRSVGLLEHPGIWVLLGLQVALPMAIRRSLANLARARRTLCGLTASQESAAAAVIEPIVRFAQLRDPLSRVTAAAFFGAGLIAFVWNTYQNQFPNVVVPFDFWDSAHHSAGFWVTRVYKAYLLLWLLPYIALLHAGVLVTVLLQIRRARMQGWLKLVPFHIDDAGGLGFVPGLVTNPIIVALLLGSVAAAAAFQVHRAADVTPIMGLAVLLVSAAVAYGVPIAFLRTDIVALKKEALSAVRKLQQEHYAKTISSSLSVETVREGNDALEYFERLATRIESISNYPHLKRFAAYMGLAVTPSMLSAIIEFSRETAPLIAPFVQRP